jgi:hypothetical protein
MNTVIHVSRIVHHGLRITLASELARAHTPGWLHPRGVDGVTSTRRGSKRGTSPRASRVGSTAERGRWQRNKRAAVKLWQ